MLNITSTEAGATGRYVNLGSSACQDDIGAQTIIVYAKPTGSGGGGFGYLFGKTPAGSINGLRMFITHNGGAPQLCFGAYSTTGGAPSVQGAAGEVTYGNWAHFDMTWDGGLLASGMHVYVNDVETARTIDADGTGVINSDAANDLFLFNRGASGNLAREFVGDTAYVARWNRVLDSTERALVHSSGPLAVPLGLILCWADGQDYSASALTATERSTLVAGSTPTITSLGGDRQESFLVVTHETSPYMTVYNRSGDVFTKLADPATLPSSTNYGASFTPDGSHLAVGGSSVAPRLAIYSRSGQAFTRISDPAALPAGNCYGVSFDSTGEYLGLGFFNDAGLIIHKRAGNTFTKLADPAAMPPGTFEHRVAFDSSSTYFAVALLSNDPRVYIYKRAGDVFTKLADPATIPAGSTRGVAFSKDATYLTVAHGTSPFMTTYKRSGDTFTKLADPATLPAGAAQGCAYSYDDVYLAVVSDTAPRLTIYKRSGDTFTRLTDPATQPGVALKGVEFSRDGEHLTVVSEGSPYVYTYKRSGDTFTKLADPATLPTGRAFGVAYYPRSFDPASVVLTQVGLTGQTIAHTQGAMTASVTSTMAGQSFTHTQGLMVVESVSNVTLELVGQSYTLAQGAPAIGTSAPVTGQSYTHTAGVLTATQMALGASYERSSAILATSSIAGVGDSAVVSIRPKVQDSESGNFHTTGEWLEPSVEVTGVNGYRPTFRFLNYFNGDTGMLGADDSWSATRRPMYSYDDGVTWAYFDTAVTRDTTNNWIEFRHSTAFTANKVRIGRSRQMTVHQVGDWLSATAATYSSFFVPTTAAAAYTPSGSVSGFAAQTFIADEFSTQTDSLSLTVPVTPFYAAEINDTSLMPASGLPKRVAVITGGVHAGEDHANHVLKAFVAHLCGASAEAQAIRREYRILIYPMINAPGRAGGGWRGSWTQGLAGADDANRHFSDTDSTLQIVDKPKAAITTDRATTVPDWFIDFHGDWGGTWGIELDAGYTPGSRFKDLLATHSGDTVGDVGNTLSGFLTTYFDTLGAKLVVIHESGDTTQISDANITTHGAAVVQTLNSMMGEGAFFTVLPNQSYTHAQGAPGVSVTVALAGQSYEYSQGAFGVSTGGNVTVGLTGQSVAYTQGTLDKVTAVLASGSTYTFAQGGLSAAVSTGLTGQSYALTQGSVSASGGSLPSGTVDLSPATINALALAIADAIYTHPSALSCGAIATAVWAKTLP